MSNATQRYVWQVGKAQDAIKSLDEWLEDFGGVSPDDITDRDVERMADIARQLQLLVIRCGAVEKELA